MVEEHDWTQPFPRKDNWHDEAKCKDEDITTFYPVAGEKYQAIRYNKHYCDDCPVKRECLDYALANRLDDGLWGGTIPGERKKMFKHYKGVREYDCDNERRLFPTLNQLSDISMDDTSTAAISGNLFNILADHRRLYSMGWEDTAQEGSSG